MDGYVLAHWEHYDGSWVSDLALWFLEHGVITSSGSYQGLGNTNSPKGIDELLSSPLLWTGLYHGSSPPFCHHIQTTSGPLGKDQPAIRKVTWSILLTLLNRHDGKAAPVTSSSLAEYMHTCTY